MRGKRLILIGSACAAAFIAVWFTVHHFSSLEYMQRITGVRLPGGIREVSTYDNGEMYVTAHVLLPSNTINGFANAFGFAPDPNPQFGLLGMEQLDPRFRKIPQDADLLAYAGRSRKNTWKFVMDRRSGHLWFTVQYPDFAGDAP